MNDMYKCAFTYVWLSCILKSSARRDAEYVLWVNGEKSRPITFSHTGSNCQGNVISPPEWSFRIVGAKIRHLPETGKGTETENCPFLPEK